MVKTKIGVNHNNPERIDRGGYVYIKKHFEKMDKLGNDPFTIKEIATPRHLDTSIWKHLD
jgi:hypothetical protein